jgi:multiple sugar transport system substrate-binding protein
MKRTHWIGIALLLVMVAALGACAQPTPEVVTVVETKVVEKVVEKEGEVQTVVETKEVEVEVVITATPEPTASPYDESAPIEVWVDSTRLEAMDMWVELHPDQADLVNVSQYDRGQFANQVLFFNNVGEGWPDVIFAEPRYVSQLADAAHNFAGDLTPWVPQDVVDGFAPNSLDPCIIDGKLYCLRNDLAQGILYYNIPLMEEYGYEIPTTWDEYVAIGEDIAANGYDLIIGSVGDVWSLQMYFGASECPMTDRRSLTQFCSNPTHENCVRAAEMIDYLVELGVLATIRPLDPAFVEQYVATDKMLMLFEASWFGEYIFGGTEESMYYKSADGQLGMALPPVFEGQEHGWSAAHGGAAWAMSRHTKNPKLASEVIVWLATGEYQHMAPTQPAYLPAAEKWAETVRGNPLYGVDPWPVYEETAGYIWPNWIPDARFPYRPEVTRLLVDPMVNEGAKLVDQLEPLQEALEPLGAPAGLEILTDCGP